MNEDFDICLYIESFPEKYNYTQVPEGIIKPSKKIQTFTDLLTSSSLLSSTSPGTLRSREV